MNERSLSNGYDVRKLSESDIEEIFSLCFENKIFYQYHPPIVTRESILEDLSALPPNKELKDKYFVGFYEKKVLVAVMDLILDYPADGTAYIGFFMLKLSCQGQGIATDIVRDIVVCLREYGYRKIRLAIDEGNPQSEAFWSKNHFRKTGEKYPSEVSVYLPMELQL